jgi:hypothetical protein
VAVVVVEHGDEEVGLLAGGHLHAT